MLTPLDSKVSDINAENLGISVKDLMGNAGKAVADFLNERFAGNKVLFVCGPGNNGGDGFAAALRLDPAKTSVALLCEPSKIHTSESRYYYSLLECTIARYSDDMLDSADVIVDCALGTGARGSIREPYASFIKAANASGKTAISVDVPSGLGCNLAVKPRYTITFMDVKEGMDQSNCGSIVICDIGIPYEAYHNVGPGDMLRYPIPGPDSHKGQNGRLMIIAGGPYYGAPSMSSCSALRTGADIVRLFSPENIHHEIASCSPVLMITDLPGRILCRESVKLLLQESLNYDAVLIGPGLGTDNETMEAVREFVSECTRPLVVDADGLTAIRGMRLAGNAVLTPHHGEFERLGGGNPEDLARIMNATVLLKGRIDMITDGARSRINTTGTPAMTGAGTGDVLAGCVSALISKGMSCFDAACLGAYICGKAGEIGFKSKSYGLIATDIIDCIPSVLCEGLK